MFSFFKFAQSNFSGYIANPSSFPQPLNSEQEVKYLEMFRHGDDDARNVLIERNLRLVAHIVKKYSSSTEESDDLISIGTIGLIKAISTFDNQKGTRLATYAARCIDNEILMHLRAAKKIKSEVSLHEPIGTDLEGNDIVLLDIMYNDGDSVIDEVDLRMQVKQLYNNMRNVLRKREKTVLEMRYGLCDGVNLTQREIGKLLGISRSYVSRIEKKAIKKLMREF